MLMHSPLSKQQFHRAISGLTRFYAYLSDRIASKGELVPGSYVCKLDQSYKNASNESFLQSQAPIHASLTCNSHLMYSTRIYFSLLRFDLLCDSRRLFPSTSRIDDTLGISSLPSSANFLRNILSRIVASPMQRDVKEGKRTRNQQTRRPTRKLRACRMLSRLRGRMNDEIKTVP